jgi:hypothetical protein
MLDPNEIAGQLHTIEGLWRVGRDGIFKAAWNGLSLIDSRYYRPFLGGEAMGLNRIGINSYSGGRFDNGGKRRWLKSIEIGVDGAPANASISERGATFL